MQELADGVRVELARGAAVTVHTHRGMLELTSARGFRRVFASSRAGLRAVLARLARMGDRGRATRSAPKQQDLFAVAPPRAEHPRDWRSLEQPLIASLRRSALRRSDVVSEAEDAVARERDTPLVFSCTVLDLPYYLRDAARQRAAAIAGAHLETVAHTSEREGCAHALFSRLGDWPRLFTHTGVVSRALHKTLANVPPDVPGADVWALRPVELIAPVKSALHLRLLAERARREPAELQEHARRLQLADERELEDLRHRAAQALGLGRLSIREQEHVLIEVLVRGGTPGPGDSLRVLVRRGLAGADWRRRHEVRAHHRTPTARPSIPLPEAKGVTFLASVGHVMQEGERMGHCVGSHAPEAVSGGAFLFHVEHDGAAATVEVDASGAVVEAQGPRNKQNGAADYGDRVLGAWGSAFWASRAGELDGSVWPPHAPPPPPGFTALTTVGACVTACQRMAWTLKSPGAVSAWFAHHLRAVLAGEAVLVADSGDPGRGARALDIRGVEVGRFPAPRR